MPLLFFAFGAFQSFLFGVVAGLWLAQFRNAPPMIEDDEKPQEERRDNVVPFRPIPRRPTF